jgi:signal transduction histidine kinase
MNLLSNAIDAIGENGTITITSSQENGKARISIRDTGKGISDDIIKKIFDPFFTTKEVGQGTGLGLSISYGIIKKHHGEIHVTSKKGEGAEFIVTLPLSV